MSDGPHPGGGATASWWRVAANLPAARPERGAAAVLAIGVIVSIITVTVGGLLVAAAVIASQRARLAADLAAIAGATAARNSAGLRDGCDEAARVAALNGASLVRCRTVVAPASGVPSTVGDVTVEVTVEVAAVVGPARGRSRAGPASGR